MTKLHSAKPPASPPPSPLPSVTLHEGEPVTTSLAVAAHFEKRHTHVLRAIEKLIEECAAQEVTATNFGVSGSGGAPKIGGISTPAQGFTEPNFGLSEPGDRRNFTPISITEQEFTERNFAFSEYTDSTGRPLPMYLLTKDGFALLAMGFTGAKALRWKIAYIKAFNAMAKELAGQHRVQAQGEGMWRATEELVGRDRLHTIRLVLACADTRLSQNAIAWCCLVSRHVVSRILKKYAHLRPLADDPIYKKYIQQRRLDYEVMCLRAGRRLPL